VQNTPKLPSHSLTFTKKERLKSQKLLSSLFGGGISFASHPVRFIWREADLPEGSEPVQVAFSVPKKNFKKAVDRHRVKRLLSEIWRHHKHKAYEGLSKQSSSLALVILYQGKEELSYAELDERIAFLIRRMLKKNSEKDQPKIG